LKEEINKVVILANDVMEWDGVVSLGYKKTYAVAKSMILTILADSIGIGIQNYRVFFINRTMDLSKMYLDSTI